MAHHMSNGLKTNAHKLSASVKELILFNDTYQEQEGGGVYQYAKASTIGARLKALYEGVFQQQHQNKGDFEKYVLIKLFHYINLVLEDFFLS